MFEKRIVPVLYALLMLLTLCACSTPEPDLPIWYFGLEDVDGDKVVTAVECAEMKEENIELAVTVPDGSVMEGTWEGYYLKDLLAYVGVTEYTSLTLTAHDGSVVELTPEQLDEYAVFIAVKLDREYVWLRNDENGGSGAWSPWAIATGETTHILTEEIDGISVN